MKHLMNDSYRALFVYDKLYKTIHRQNKVTLNLSNRAHKAS